MRKFYSILIVLLFSSCAAMNESTMPFYNYSYYGSRLFPVQSNDTEKTFRVWFNNGTSVDRVITISKDDLISPYRYDGCICEIGFGNKKIKQREIVPASGYEAFFEKLDSLSLFDIQSPQEFAYRLGHIPIALYVIEVKDENKYHQFWFNSYYPYGGPIDNSNTYGVIEQFIMDEFGRKKK